MTRRAFGLTPGFEIAGKYEVLEKLGSGWEGEVYRVRERRVGVERAAKLFFPENGSSARAVRFYARKLHKLRRCKILIQYHAGEKIEWDGRPVDVLISEYVEGEMLADFVRRRPGGRLAPFEGLHLLHELASGVEEIHRAGEYHGDLHDDNIFVRRKGLSFNLKVVDMYNWGRPRAENVRDDVCDMVRILYDVLGGRPRYARQPDVVKYIVSGLKRSIITRKFRTAGHLRRHLESMEWE